MGFVDPGDLLRCRHLGRPLDEAVGAGELGSIWNDLTLLSDLGGLAIVDQCGRHQADAGMPGLVVVPGEAAQAESPRVRDGAEASREIMAVPLGPELALRIGVFVGNTMPAVRCGDAEVGEEKRHIL